MKDSDIELLPSRKQNTNKINVRPKDEPNMIFHSVNRNFSYLAIIHNEKSSSSLNLFK